jgi:hypothetical protein
MVEDAVVKRGWNTSDEYTKALMDHRNMSALLRIKEYDQGKTTITKIVNNDLEWWNLLYAICSPEERKMMDETYKHRLRANPVLLIDRKHKFYTWLRWLLMDFERDMIVLQDVHEALIRKGEDEWSDDA